MSNNHKTLANRLSKLEALATPRPRIVDATGCREIILARLSNMRAAMATEDPRYLDPEYSPYTPEEAERRMSNLTERLQRTMREQERRWNVRYVSHTWAELI